MFYLLLLGHWVSDFIMQTDEMAQNKSKSLKWLVIHVSAYTLVLSAFALPILFIESFDKWTAFVLTNGVSHGIIDMFTSKLSSKMWKQQRVHDFFVVIGFDQLLHVAILYWSWRML